MRRTIEKFAFQRQQKQDAFKKELDELKKKAENFCFTDNIRSLQSLLSDLAGLIKTDEEKSSKKGRSLLTLKTSKKLTPPFPFEKGVFLVLTEFQRILDQYLSLTRDTFSSVCSLMESDISLMDAKDREWDALGSNHVGMIFKSMEWRVDKLAASYEDMNLLMKKFLLIREKLDRLLGALEKKKLPSRQEIQPVLQPLKDWQYAGFENRYRGSEAEVKKQQSQYLSFFQKNGKVLDLGCGRGEFLELLRDNGIDAQGIEISEQMVDICHDNGLNCRRGDILEILAQTQDNTLGGIFSSQVIEHLPPPYLKKLIELAYFKLKPGSHIVLETLNPASVFALVQIYFLDLTHQMPIHPQALKFLLESTGFENVELKYSESLEQEQLQTLPGSDEVTAIMNSNIDTLNKLLYAAPNYAAIGLK
jgi:2-polyprenyl-3-methyl-5-hydroxy-6-metoxy-1,4-benzoquinol methylase